MEEIGGSLMVEIGGWLMVEIGGWLTGSEIGGWLTFRDPWMADGRDRWMADPEIANIRADGRDTMDGSMEETVEG